MSHAPAYGDRGWRTYITLAEAVRLAQTVEKNVSRRRFLTRLTAWGDKWNRKWGVGPEVFTLRNAERYGVSTLIGRFAGAGTREFAPPTAGRGQDWVPVLDDGSRRFPPPGAKKL